MNNDQAYRVLREADLLVGEAEVSSAIGRMAQEITERLGKSNPVLICVMNGGLIFSGQLLTRLVFPLEIDYIHATRYGHETRGDRLNWIVRPQLDLGGRTVLLLDDILDEGITLAAIAEECRRLGAREVLRDLENTELPFIMFSYCKGGKTAYENIDFGSKWDYSRFGGLGFAFG